VTTYSCKNGEITLSCVNFSGYARHVTIFNRMLTIASYFVVWIGLGLGLGLDLVFGWLVVMHRYLCDFRLSLSHCSPEQSQGCG